MRFLLFVNSKHFARSAAIINFDYFYNKTKSDLRTQTVRNY